MESIAKVFREKKLKLTPQRIAVYKYLLSTTSHPSAEVIYKAIQEDYPTMSFATVYKTLKTLTSVNLVQELNVGEGNFRYDANVDAHPHIQCIECGRVDDIHNVSFENLNSVVSEFSDYTVLSNQIYFYGVCGECKSKNISR
ncbi:Fur family transcriptional regulator [Clostridium cellulovorans]|uniref:Ferric uptake regulator, Fur family n=1 Tax=Clostridium cellulovorans (strain ATCC 35296 / DSM 3052 / OCM 3 / 743B) TaxID=573061 RepID=D9SWW3_CLOC7|nr:Fur family transcriptional regulator [Clostridium cellulovorans]ADL51324.1 ferric uptake regulator, Fur family [Clostridium cellulovorans 743B]